MKSEALPADYTDPKVPTNSIAAMCKVPVLWSVGGDDAFNKEQIITQKWLAMFPNGQEGWSEFRRTGYPKIFPVVNNNSAGEVSTELQIRRVKYPYKEKVLNADNYAEGVKLLGGADIGGTPVWWDTRR